MNTSEFCLWNTENRIFAPHHLDKVLRTTLWTPGQSPGGGCSTKSMSSAWMKSSAGTLSRRPQSGAESFSLWLNCWNTFFLQEQDLNLRLWDYEPHELPDCSILRIAVLRIPLILFYQFFFILSSFLKLQIFKKFLHFFWRDFFLFLAQTNRKKSFFFQKTVHFLNWEGNCEKNEKK